MIYTKEREKEVTVLFLTADNEFDNGYGRADKNPTPYATSFRRRFLGYYHAMAHPYSNIILSLFSIPLVLKCAAKILNIRIRDQDSLLVKCRNVNHSPRPVIRELVPSCHQRSELSNTILCIFSG